MDVIGTDIGNYIDPNFIDASVAGSIGPINPSWGGDIMGLHEVPLTDGRVAIVNSDGMIVDYK